MKRYNDKPENIQKRQEPRNQTAGLEARTRRPRSGGRRRRGPRRSSSSSSSSSKTTTVAATPKPAPAPVGKPTKVEIPEVISVRDLAETMGTTPIEIIKTLMSYGTMATINELVDFDTASIIGEELGIKVAQETISEPEIEPGAEGPKTLRERLIDLEDDPSKLKPRPPVVTVLGHVDHGKTTLLDAIRDTDVVAGESGGITQHIAAYQVEVDGRKITFLDTPGHAAFTAMRARGAQATDIAIMVIAADDGVMPQTREAIAHARAARVPILVALNKIDKDNANPDHVKQQLADLGLQPEEWGGDTVVVPISAKKRVNIDELLENVLLIADVMELKANPDGEAIGTVIEANQDRHLGNVATVLVQKGTLKTGDSLVIGQVWGRVRAEFDDQGKSVTKATPSMPVLVTGLQGIPDAGDIFQVVLSQRLTRETQADPFTIYRALRMLNPSPYMYFLDFQGVAGVEGEPVRIIGSSPEMHVRLEDGVAQVHPIAGTRWRGDSPEEDEALAEDLLNDPKERAEHVMLVDLGRNDVGKVAVPGTVKVPRLMEVERYSHVMHIVSTVEGELQPGMDGFDLFVATFPAGTVTGAPKVRAMEIISELEQTPRGPYAGAVGYFGFQGIMDFCITIRTLFQKGTRLYLQAGAGIVADSDPEREYQETLNKARGMIKAIEMAQEGL